MALTRPAKAAIGVLAAAAFAAVALLVVTLSAPAPWSQEELMDIGSLSLSALPPLSPDATNAVADDPRAQTLGHRLFFDVRLSSTGSISCATCHQPEQNFTDGLVFSRAIGTTRRNAPSIVGLGHSPWLYWDGRKDSLWSQALAPLEDASEHGSNRLQIARLVTTDPVYRDLYADLFGAPPSFDDPERFPQAAGPVADPVLAAAWRAMSAGDKQRVNVVFANVGKAIGAYERLLLPGRSRFDVYADAVVAGQPTDVFSDQEVAGLRLFIGDANCTQCHNGPLLTNNSFHNTGLLSSPGALPDKGRVTGIRQARADPFNCLGEFSDDREACAELRFANTGDETIGAFKTPSLRNLSGTAPYGHAGQLTSLSDVLEHYNEAPDAMIGHNEAKPLELYPWQLGQLEAFLNTLAAPPATASRWLRDP